MMYASSLASKIIWTVTRNSRTYPIDSTFSPKIMGHMCPQKLLEHCDDLQIEEKKKSGLKKHYRKI